MPHRSQLDFELHFTALDERSAREVTRWRYRGRYSTYDGSERELPVMLDSAHRYFAGWREDEFIGYCCFGSDARVPGGNYTRGEPEVLDVGGGFRPNLVGRGMGEGLARQVLAFACERFRPQSLRVTVLSSNPRARALCRRLGFRAVHRFAKLDVAEEQFIQFEVAVQSLKMHQFWQERF
jgi:[ribosomal protein S18]-alanine N-acetyltransferase